LSNPSKTEGNSGACWRCSNTIFCNKIEYNGQPKLQWQNKDRKSHYTKDGDCKKDTTQQTADSQQTKFGDEQNLSKGESHPETISLYTLDEKLDKIKEIETFILHLITDLKTNGVKMNNE